MLATGSDSDCDFLPAACQSAACAVGASTWLASCSVVCDSGGSGDEDFLPHVAPRACAPPRPGDSNDYDVDVDWTVSNRVAGTSGGPSESTAVTPAQRMMAQSRPDRYQSRQGSYSRDTSSGRGLRRSHAEYAWRHREAAETFTLGRACNERCPFKRQCGMFITPHTYLSAHERMYGPSATRELDGDEGPWKYACQWSEAQTMAARRNLMSQSFISPSGSAPTGKLVGHFFVEGTGPVCEMEFRKAYDLLRESVWKSLSAAARKGNVGSDALVVAEGLGSDNVDGALESYARESAVEWWKAWLMLEDQMPNEPVIVHRVVIWGEVYDKEYLADMVWWMTSGKSLSRQRWTSLRSDALVSLSFDWYGADSRDPAKPATLLRLLERARKSNFGMCTKCFDAKQKWFEYRTTPATRKLLPSEVQAFKKQLNQHIREVKREREKANTLMRDCGYSVQRNAQFDDKCGSNYLNLPVFNAYREPPEWAGRWRYRCGLQGNLYPGDLLRFSLVPPHLRTGSNFGSTAWLAGVSRMHDLGKLGTEAVRQTDSGPDNIAQETHALNISLISRGIFNKITWIRLMPKHSHNLSDRMNSLLKEVIEPKRGTHSQGCMAPWDMEEKLNKAMKSQSGLVEFGWHMANYDFKEFFKGCISKELTGTSAARWFIYENDPTLTDHFCCRVTYREDLLDAPPNSREPEFKPAKLLPNGTYVTDPSGEKIMTKLPDFSKPPPLEHFLFNEKSQILEGKTEKNNVEGKGKGKGGGGAKGGKARKSKQHWGKTKVFGDIEVLAPSFSDAQRSQWEVLSEFHSKYDTADKLPKLPLTLTAADNSQWVLKGQPFDWSETWSKLSWRCHRAQRPADWSVDRLANDPAALLLHDRAAAPAVAPAVAPAGGQLIAARPVAEMNVVTGLTNPRAARKVALRDTACENMVEKLLPHLEAVKKGQLVFVKLKPDVVEGALMVAVGRAKADAGGEGGSDCVKMAWFTRNQWACSEGKRRWEWATTPFFKALPHTSDTKELMSDILPIAPELTSASEPNKPRLTSACVRMLLALCQHRELVHSDAVRQQHLPALDSGSGSDLDGGGSDSSDGSAAHEGPAKRLRVRQ